VKYEAIETTLPKAKEIVPYIEKLITKAKKGDLHNRRQIISKLQTIASAHKLMDDIAPQLAGRTSGHVRIEKTRTRRGDNAQMARVSFVDDLTAAPVAKSAAATAGTSRSTASASTATTAKAKTPAKAKASTASKTDSEENS
jgi:large subunit ribosomal protein L17